ncbi:MAG: RsmB/NOP family class I SAM-dependent RNA methyltransferase [Rhodobacter sp.]|nr:RsmB/NOP family class I SAM-dependent RNA methyltransferase [Rhodobacter sp.]
MTPAARIQASIGILDAILDGAPAEQTLTTWARRNRYAGSGDRAAVRDHVFGALRCRRSFAWLGGAETGRALMLGAVRAAGQDPADLFTGAAYAPLPLTADETRSRSLEDAPEGVRLDMPDWLLPALRESLGDAFEPVCRALRHRAPVFLRSNLRKATRGGAASALRAEGIETRPHPLSPTALEVTANARKVQGSKAFADGLVEVQDAASQAVVDALPLDDGDRVLDYCAGGGGKALAMAARADLRVVAHDSNPGRMRDIPFRAARAGAAIGIWDKGRPPAQPGFDLVLCDAPCSGSGAWRRTPDAKWRLTAGGLRQLQETQLQVLTAAAELVRPGGHLAYVTCSLLGSENGGVISAFRAGRRGWSLSGELRLTPLDGGDGFYLGLLTSPSRRT